MAADRCQSKSPHQLTGFRFGQIEATAESIEDLCRIRLSGLHVKDKSPSSPHFRRIVSSFTFRVHRDAGRVVLHSGLNQEATWVDWCCFPVCERVTERPRNQHQADAEPKEDQVLCATSG